MFHDIDGSPRKNTVIDARAGQKTSHQIMIVTDASREASYPRTIGEFELVVLPLHKVTQPPTILVIDVDVLDFGNVQSLRRLDMQATSAIAVCLDPSNHHARTQAYALGATVLLPKPLQFDHLATLAARETMASRMDESCRVSIVGAASALEESFSTLKANSNLDSPQIRQSSAEIVSAITARGMEPWLNTVRVKHTGTFQHCLVVTGVATAFGHGTGMCQTDIALLTTTGLLHDIGKAQIPTEILDKPGELTSAEMAVMRAHPVIGHRYLAHQGCVQPEVLSAVRHHHEYLDGSGYPDGLSGSGIDDLTRVLTVCDIYGALVELRPYKPPKSPEQAIRILRSMAAAGKVEKALVGALARVVHVDEPSGGRPVAGTPSSRPHASTTRDHADVR